MVAQPATLMSVLLLAALTASVSTVLLLRAPIPGYDTQAMKARRSINWPLAAKLLPVRNPSTTACGRILSVPLRTMV